MLGHPMKSQRISGELFDYYKKTSILYDEMHIIHDDEHERALRYLNGILESRKFSSILDVGCGTGRVLLSVKSASIDIRAIGIEPSEDLRKIAIEKGLKESDIIIGEANALPFKDNEFDCVTAFGVMHHIETPSKAISEIMRVAKYCVFISDHNVYGWGSKYSRAMKNIFRLSKLWSLFCYAHTLGKGYYDTDYDGIFFPFSILDHSNQIKKEFPLLQYLTTKCNGDSLYWHTSHLAIYAEKAQARSNQNMESPK